MKCTVNIFAKVPRVGTSKTRLAKSIGDAYARRIANWLFAKTIRSVQDRRWNTNLLISPDRECPRVKFYYNLVVRPQGLGNLGERLKRALDLSPLGKIVFIGTDTADISPQHITMAFKALNQHNLVFGPSNDGGFWLMGINKNSLPRHDSFKNVRWSTEHAMADVIANFPQTTSIYYLERLIDIDDGEDWRAWCASARTGVFLD